MTLLCPLVPFGGEDVCLSESHVRGYEDDADPLAAEYEDACNSDPADYPDAWSAYVIDAEREGGGS